MVNKFLTLAQGEDAARRTVITKFGTVAAGTTEENPVFVAPYPCEVVAASLVNAADMLGSNQKETFTLRDKGALGDDDNVIGTIQYEAFNAFDEVKFETLDAAHRILAEGDVVSLKKVPSDSGFGTDEMIVKLEYKRH